MPPDPKRGKRIVDRTAVRRTLLIDRACAACGRAAANAHHIVQKGSPHFGDDVEGNLLPICGSGTMGCHGAIHGTPYEVQVAFRSWTERRDAEWVGRRLGLAIAARPAKIQYVLEKLGDSAGREYLARFYYLDGAAIDRALASPWVAR